MTLQSSGLITLSDIQDEFGGVNPISLSEYYRGGSYVTDNNTGVPTSGTNKFSFFYNTVKQFIFTISSSVKEAELRTLALAAGWDGVAPIVANVAEGVYLWSDNTSSGGLYVNNVPTGSIINNYGYIIGKGGSGNATTAIGGDGGPALVNSVSGISIFNFSGGYIAGGGGAGGGHGGGGGAGGGVGGAGRNFGGGADNLTEGDGGAIGLAGGNTTGTLHDGLTHATGGGAGGGGGAGWDTGSSNFGSAAGAGGGRILTGSGGIGALNTYGCGGFGSRGCGGNGGSTSTGSNFNGGAGSGGGGGWGAAGGDGGNGVGGAGGAAISGTSVTLTNNGTIYGAVA